MKEAIQAIQQAINCLTKDVTGWRDLEYSSSHNQQLVMNHPQHGKIPLAQLSDGLRNAVADGSGYRVSLCQTQPPFTR
ncbi:ATP-binding protein [Salmonella enterica subsp. enterica serovar Daytona]|uniref:ATP-binding protein n=1 Tax=Salmonella enterica subsp. enterica serovar Daytona TaxID=1962639 RepID=A0A447JA12_SALET|nr:ATP-binding protein [Salmonella enterica subsp. enterica serovar Daytona]